MAGNLESYPGGWGEQSQMRISDDDRHRVAEFLRESAGEGRIDMEELDERLGQAYAAKVYADLVPIVADLPGSSPVVPVHRGSTAPRQAGSVPERRFETSIAIMSGSSRKGVWEVGATHAALALMGGVELDLREAVFSTGETVINAYAVMGGVDITVNAHTRVVVDGIGIMGGFEQGRDKVPADLGPDSPVVRVRGVALMGGVSVTRKQMPGEPGPWRQKLLGS
jgi:hypothetical protein